MRRTQLQSCTEIGYIWFIHATVNSPKDIRSGLRAENIFRRQPLLDANYRSFRPRSVSKMGKTYLQKAGGRPVHRSSSPDAASTHP
jgi:hypothetical protein